mmetsp:Transcript_3851/g.15543  ORF Transcript_3851/g.15543 Transcript_3851/m.15543 type:complete len:285 (-) Transcript_3851:83-937(-)
MRYLVTHNDATGRVQVAVSRGGGAPEVRQDWYARMMRDEVHGWWVLREDESEEAQGGGAGDRALPPSVGGAEGVVCAGLAIEPAPPEVELEALASRGVGRGGRDAARAGGGARPELHLLCSLNGTTMGAALASAGEGRSVRAPTMRLLARAAAASAAALRKEVFREHMPLVVACLAAAAEADARAHPELLDARVVVHYCEDGAEHPLLSLETGVDRALLELEAAASGARAHAHTVEVYDSVRAAAEVGTEWLRQDEAQERRAAAAFMLLAAIGATAGAYFTAAG